MKSSRKHPDEILMIPPFYSGDYRAGREPPGDLSRRGPEPGATDGLDRAQGGGSLDRQAPERHRSVLASRRKRRQSGLGRLAMKRFRFSRRFRPIRDFSRTALSITQHAAIMGLQRLSF